MWKLLFDKIKLLFVGIIVTLGFVAYIFSTELELLWLAVVGGFIVSFFGVWVGISKGKKEFPEFFGITPDDERNPQKSHTNNRIIVTFVFMFLFVYVSMLVAYLMSIN